MAVLLFYGRSYLQLVPPRPLVLLLPAFLFLFTFRLILYPPPFFAEVSSIAFPGLTLAVTPSPTVRYSFLGQGAKKTARLSSIIYFLSPCARAAGVYFHNCGCPYVLFPPVLRNKAHFHRICRSLLPRSSHAGFPVLSRTDALQTCLPVPSRPGALIPVPLLCVCGGRMFHVKHPAARPAYSGELSLAEQVAFRGNVSRETFLCARSKFSCKFLFFCGQRLESTCESCYNSTRAKAADFGRSAHQQSAQAAPIGAVLSAVQGKRVLYWQKRSQ